MHTIAVVNQKGGCGKTTTAINLSGVLASRGYRTLLVDLDPQAHCAAGLAIPEQRIDKHIGDAMVAADNSPIDADRLLWRVSRNLDLAPSTVRLAALEAARGEFAQKADAESRLKKALARFGGQYDFCVIDCSPAIGILTFNALVAADEILVPVETAFFSLAGAAKQVNTIKSVAKRLGVQPSYRLLPTMHDPESALARNILDELRRKFAGRVLPVVIRLDPSLREAASFGQPVVEYSRESMGAADYGDLATVIVEQPAGRRGVVCAEAEPEEAMPEVHVVPGIAERATARVLEEVRDAAAQGPGNGGLVVEVVSQRTVVTAAVTEPLPAVAPTRAADLVARAKKLHARNAEPRVMRAPAAIDPVVGQQPVQVEPKPVVREAIAAEPVRVEAALPVKTGEDVWFGVRVTERGVVFRQPLTLGRNVRIAGEFNNWSDVATPLRPHATLGVLEGVAAIAPGTFQYRVVVDSQWIADPYNPLVAPNPFGGANSIVVVPAGEGTRARSGGLS